MSSTLSTQEATRNAVVALVRACDYDAAHTHQVTRLSLRLFDGLLALHQLDQPERFWLECAALLHDIGWVDGKRGHHKKTLSMILSTPMLPFNSKERLIVGSIARYHRKALPDLSHDHYAALDIEERAFVDRLAALLRLADGLDASHQSRVEDVNCKIQRGGVILQCRIRVPAPEEKATALEKSDLFQQVFQTGLQIRWKRVRPD